MYAIGRDTATQKLRQKARTINALLVRELMVRFGHGNIGFMWLVGEPLILTIGVMGMWTLLYGEQKHGVKIMPLVLTGYSTLTLFRHIIGSYVNCFRANAGLLFHRTVRPVDTIIARGLLETIGVLIAFFVAYVPMRLLGYFDPIYDYSLLLSAWFLFCFGISGFGMIVACICQISETAERFVQPMLYLAIPATGSFFMVAWLPETAQKIVLLSPLVHCNEMFRAGYFGPSVATSWNGWYVVTWALVNNAIAWTLVKRTQRHIEIS
ncbi:ABC transporter permease [Rhizobium sp. SG2393]|uniref:ABC transporter permease n=1 Tax=Rhizobium sp. SG2393 TaxID=3276279 RepID=UPI00366AAE78